MKYRNLAAIVIIVSLLMTGSTGPAWAGAGSTSPGSSLGVEMLTALDTAAGDDHLSVIIRLKEQALENSLQLQAMEDLPPADRVEAVVTTLQAQAESSQGNLRRFLEEQQRLGTVSEITPFWIFNGLAVKASPEVIRQLAEFPEVEEIRPDAVIYAPTLPEETGSIQTQAALANLQLINAPALWSMGIKGKGVVVAIVDSGVDYTHPDLYPSYRGGSNSWFDTHGESDIPVDYQGHGTHVLGTMVGKSVGIAPDAKWIAVKIFNRNKSGSDFHGYLGLQWVLSQAQASPNTRFVVNNSWGSIDPGCYESANMRTVLKALRAAGILPIFSAGNSGPNPSTDVSPANLPEAFSVGAIDNNGNLAGFSSRGPSSCNGGIFPKVTAPGVGIFSTFPNTPYDKYGYATLEGTSMAAPHVTGGLALLLSAFPNLTVAEQEAALLNTVVDLGPVGPDNSFGYGRIDLLQAYKWVKMKKSPIKYYLPQLFLQPEE